ncbi:MAG: HNH endonuclease, partial [Neisseriaceae bacterium]|nr:HNH endonuclease [Neisseriaceae bacterium]
RNSIEHFYPQNPTDGQTKWEDKDLHSFGNLTLITVSGNSKFSNLLPHAKVTSYESIIKQQSPKLKLMSQENNWTQETAQKHGKEMLGLLEKEIQQQINQ